jgi:hypothetical protein
MRALAGVAVLVFVAFCVGGWTFLRSVLDGDGTPVTWTHYQAQGQTLIVSYEGDTCEENRSIEVRESNDEVVVTVRIDDTRGIPFITGCVEDGESLRVELDASLGDRSVIDGACLTHSPRESCIRAPMSG